MKYILGLVTCVFLLSHSSLKAQQPSFEGRIILSHVSDGKEMMDYNYRISEDGFRLEREFLPMKERLLPEILFTVKDSSWVQIEHLDGIVKYMKPEPNENASKNSIRPLNETEMFMGYLCDKYEVETWVSFEGKMAKSIYWVARELKVNWAKLANEVTNSAEFLVRASDFTNGLTLKIEMLDSKGKVKSTVSATSIEPGDLSEDFLEIPTSGYIIEGK